MIPRFSGKVRPLGEAKYAAVIDCVGGKTLANAISEVKRRGLVTCVGLAENGTLPSFVYPCKLI